MDMKCVEIRDAMTCIAALAIKMIPANEIERRFLRRCGYPPDGSCVVLMRLDDQKATSDAYSWRTGARTMTAAHEWLDRNFDTFPHGGVVDVRVLRGEQKEPAEAEIALT